MLIQGSLAEYNPAEGHSVFVLYGDDGKVYSKNNTLFLAFTGIQMNQGVTEHSDAWATLILQVDLNRTGSLTRFVTGGDRIKDSSKMLTDSRMRQKLYHVKEWIWQILFAIASGFTSPTGDLFVVGTFDTVNSKVIPVDTVADLSDGIVSFVDEYKGLPDGDNWVRLPMCYTSLAFGGTLFTSASQLSGVSAETVQKVLSAVATVVLDTGVKAMKAGANAVDFYIPPLGVMEVRYNPYNTSEISIGFEPLSVLQYCANNLYADGIWRQQDVLNTLSKLLSYHHVHTHAPTINRQNKMYQNEKKTGRRPRLLHRQLVSNHKEVECFGG